MRRLEILEIPTGEALLDLLPRLARALGGDGPALLPVAAGEAGMVPDQLRVGDPLDPGEDDDGDPTALVVATSGSTGPVKGVLLPASALTASADATRCRLTCRDGWHPHRGNGPAPVPRPRSGQWLLALPAQHIAGLQVLLRCLAEGSEPSVLDTGAPFTAARFTAAVAGMPTGTRFTSLVPTQLTRILADPEATAAATTFDAILVGGAATPDDLLHRARAGGLAVITTYGMSETCGGCVYDGVPLELVEVAVAGNGAVSITAELVARGYRGRPHDPAFVVDGRRRTFRTSDLAVMDGLQIRMVGRSDDVIVTGGVKIDPERVEPVLLRVIGVADAAITSVPDPEWGRAVVAVIVPDGAGPDHDTLRRAAIYAAGPAAAPKHVLWVEQIPRRGIGKLDRVALAALARARLAGQ